MNIKRDPKATSEYGQFFMVNTTGIKCKLNKKGRNKNDRTWNKLYVLHQNIRSLSGK
jgi:hypothetical protein